MAVKGIGKTVVADNTKDTLLFAYALYEKLNKKPPIDIREFLKKVQYEWPPISKQITGKYINEIKKKSTEYDKKKETAALLKPLTRSKIDTRMIEITSQYEKKNSEYKNLSIHIDELRKSPCSEIQFKEFLYSVVTCLSTAWEYSGASTKRRNLLQILFSGGDVNKFFPFLENKENQWGSGENETGLKYAAIDSGVGDAGSIKAKNVINMNLIKGVPKLVEDAKSVITKSAVYDLLSVMENTFVFGIQDKKGDSPSYFEWFENILEKVKNDGNIDEGDTSYPVTKIGGRNMVNFYQYGMFMAVISLYMMNKEKKYSDLIPVICSESNKNIHF